MGLFSRRVQYDRKRLLAEAERARTKRRSRRAVALYRRILIAEPHNADLHARVAPLLAQTGDEFDAWQSYRRASGALMKAKRQDAALALYREATESLPRQIEAWQWVAKLERSRGQRERARDALLGGRQHQRRRRDRPQAIALLRGALDLDPSNLVIVVDLARLLARGHQLAEAQLLLTDMAGKTSGATLRKVRAAQWRIEPSLRHTWYWLREAIAARGDGGSVAVRSAS